MFRLQLVDELARRIASYATPEPVRSRAVDPAKLQQTLDALHITPTPTPHASPVQERPGEILDTVASSNDAVPEVKRAHTPHASIASIPVPERKPEVHDDKRPSVSSSTRENATAQQHQSTLDRKHAITDLRQVILDIASLGPGFFRFNAATDSVRVNDIPMMEMAPLMAAGNSNIAQSAPAPAGVSVKQNKLEDGDVANARQSPPTINTAFHRPTKMDTIKAPGTVQTPTTALLMRKHVTAFSRIAVEDAQNRLAQIMAAQPLYSKKIRWIFMGGASAGCSGLFFEGNWTDVGVSFLFGSMVCWVGLLNRHVRYSRIHEVCAGLESLCCTHIPMRITSSQFYPPVFLRIHGFASGTPHSPLCNTIVLPLSYHVLCDMASARRDHYLCHCRAHD